MTEAQPTLRSRGRLNRVLLSVRLPNINFLPPVAKRATTEIRNNRLDYHIDLCTADTVKCDMELPQRHNSARGPQILDQMKIRCGRHQIVKGNLVTV